MIDKYVDIKLTLKHFFRVEDRTLEADVAQKQVFEAKILTLRFELHRKLCRSTKLLPV